MEEHLKQEQENLYYQQIKLNMRIMNLQNHLRLKFNILESIQESMIREYSINSLSHTWKSYGSSLLDLEHLDAQPSAWASLESQEVEIGSEETSRNHVEHSLRM